MAGTPPACSHRGSVGPYAGAGYSVLTANMVFAATHDHASSATGDKTHACWTSVLPTAECKTAMSCSTGSSTSKATEEALFCAPAKRRTSSLPSAASAAGAAAATRLAVTSVAASAFMGAGDPAAGSAAATLVGDSSAGAVGGGGGGLAAEVGAALELAAGARATSALGGTSAAATALRGEAAAAADISWLAACGATTAGEPPPALPGVGVGEGSGSHRSGGVTTARLPWAAVAAPASILLAPSGVTARSSWSPA